MPTLVHRVERQFGVENLSEELYKYCIVLYCIMLYCTVLLCIVMYCTVLICTVQYCVVLYCTVRYNILLQSGVERLARQTHDPPPGQAPGLPDQHLQPD